MPEPIPYDEFAYFADNAREFDIPFHGRPVVHRIEVPMEDGRPLSALVWGTGPPEVVLLHGGAQNAHTWDTVALALGRSLVAVDLPGHGHSAGGRAGSLTLEANAADVAQVMRELAPQARLLVGMSLGGLTSILVCAAAPELVRSLLLVDVTPGVDQEKASAITSFINGPESFADFDEILARTIQFNPTRTESSLRRGILHNALQREDGSWVWRYARFRADEQPADGHRFDYGALWAALGAVTAPVTLARGMRPQSVVDDADEAELLRRQPTARVVRFEESGHSIQGDQPVELADLIAGLLDA
ncbi:MAG: alpha/beta hydrolase [Acidimicrobiales bacterium]|nr:alpha/beta hydrolase [Acidimicrobiales bacterium]